MSGSDSSARDAAAPDRGNAGADAMTQPLRMTVYGLDEAAPVPRRTRAGRVKMLLVLLACAAPVLASYLAYFGLRPQATVNHGVLVSPPRPLPAVTLGGLDGGEVTAASLRGQWLLLVVAPAACGERCERLLFAQRQLREMLGRERERLDKVWLVSDEGPVAAPLRAALAATPAVAVLRMPAGALAAWLEAEPGRGLDEHLYLVDPRGDWMMRFPADFEPAKVRRDLDRLLRASASWDRPGR